MAKTVPGTATAAERYKIAKETRWAVLGRTIADAASHGQTTTHLVREAQIMRAAEQATSDRNIQFAALVRQIGDAASVGRDVAPLVAQLIALRRHELRPAPAPHK